MIACFKTVERVKLFASKRKIEQLECSKDKITVQQFSGTMLANCNSLSHRMISYHKKRALFVFFFIVRGKFSSKKHGETLNVVRQWCNQTIIT